MNCGVMAHNEECLCDVVVVAPVEVKHDFTEVWGADVVARATKYKEGQGGKALADFLEALGSAYDATRRIANQDDDWLEGVRTAEYVAAIHQYLSEGVSMIDLPNIMEDSFARIVAAMTNGQASIVWTWDEPRWAAWEDAIERETNTSALGREFDIDHKTAGYLLARYGKEATAVAPKPHLSRARELFRQHPDATAAEVQALLLEEGIVASTAALRKVRQRMQ